MLVLKSFIFYFNRKVFFRFSKIQIGTEAGNKGICTLTEVAPMSGIVEGGKVENDENVPPFSVLNTEENPFKPTATRNEKQLYNP
jgi:hypothetical protein